jgi:hypothetical protein
MVTWVSPLLKALPHIATIASAAGHAFHNRKGDVSAAEPTQEQIAEFQSAVSRTDRDLRKLAADLNEALAAIERGASQAERRMVRLQRLAVGSLLVALVAVAIAVAAVLMR